MAGRRSQRTTTLGASSVKRSRVTNVSASRAAESRAEAAQSIDRTSSPGRYGREPATSEPSPRRALLVVPNARPISRRRTTSGNTGSRSATKSVAAEEDDLAVGQLGPRRVLEEGHAEPLDRGAPPELARLGEEQRREDDPVAEHGQEQPVDVLRDDEA